MARPRLILHIGTSKTGTSSIQRVLGARRPALDAAGIRYVTSPGVQNHLLLPASLVPAESLRNVHPGVWEGVSPAARLARFRQDFAREMAELPARIHTLLFSAEAFSGMLNTPARIAALRDLLAPHAGEARVIVYLRRQDAHFASGYATRLRVGAAVAPTFPEDGPDRLRQYDYAALLDDWAAVFGEAAVQPRIFEPSSLAQGDVVDDFIAAAGLPLTVPAEEALRRSNLSLTPGALDLLRAVAGQLRREGGFSPEAVAWRRLVATVNDALPGRGWRADPAQAARFLARFEAVNEAVRRRWFPDRPSLFRDMPSAPPAAEAAPPNEIDAAAALEAACIALLREVEAGARREAELQEGLARLQERQGDPAVALGTWRAVLRVAPDHKLAQQRLAEAALEAGRLEEAQARLGVLQRAHPGDRVTERVARLLARARKG
jgi:tetratricopeptide (TPR) repeat protein